MYTICTVEVRHLKAFILTPSMAAIPQDIVQWSVSYKTQPAVGVDDWFLALVNNSSGLNAKEAPPIMHCLPSKQRG